MVPFTFSSGLFVYRPHFKILISYDGIFGRNLQRLLSKWTCHDWSQKNEGKLLRNIQDRVTMETCPCEVLLRHHPLQSPWRLWQRTEYSNLAWLFTMATPAGPLWRQPWGHFYGDPLGLPSEAPSKSPLGGMLYANPAKQLLTGHWNEAFPKRTKLG